MIFSSLDEHLGKFNGNIIKLNNFVSAQAAGLKARGEDTQDKLVNLFCAYTSASNCAFVTYIMKKKDEYDKEADITVQLLMDFAKTNYKTLVQEGTWNALSNVLI